MQFHIVAAIGVGLLLQVAVITRAHPPVEIQQNAKVGLVLGGSNTKFCCGNGPLTALNSQDSPWKYITVNSTGQCSQLVLNQTIGKPSGTESCWPEESWQKTGKYQCGTMKAQSLVVSVVATDNDFSPTFCNGTAKGCTNIPSLEITVPEDKPVSNVITTLKLCDKDIFQIESSTANRLSFTKNDTVVDYSLVTDIAGPHYNIKLNETLDYEAQKIHHINLTISDHKNPAYSMVLTINVKDVDDLPPTFEKKVYHCNVSEGVYSRSNTTKCRVAAKDQDTGINAEISYSIVTTDKGVAKFTVDNLGNIGINGNLDRETQATYVIPVKAYQTHREDDRFDFASIVLSVTDVDDNLPVFNPISSPISIMENTPNGTLVFQFTAHDSDEGKNEKFEYNLIQGMEAFQIDSDGRLTVKDSTKLDREMIESLSVQVQAIPINKLKPGTTLPSASLTITLIDENDNSPNFSRLLYRATIHKNQALNKNILMVTANDSDFNENGRVVYTIINTDEHLPFKIDPTTGSVQLKTSITDHHQSDYSFEIKAEDQAIDKGKRRIGLASMRVHVKDVNLHAPTISLLESLNITEVAPVGTSIAWLNITDMDTRDNLTVGLGMGNSKAKFKIENAYTTVYRIVTQSKLDRETESSYILVVSCFDGISTHNASMNVPIYILDENDNAPVFKGSTNFTVKENLMKPTVGTVMANDSDVGKNGQVFFKIDTNSQWIENFTIDQQSGLIKVKDALDREALGDQTTLFFPVFAVDEGDNPQTGTTTVTVTVTDQNDNPPVFEVTNVTYTMNERETPRLIHTAKATDRDLSPNNVIKYTLASTTPATLSDFFTLSPSNGQLKTSKSILIENTNHGSVTLQISANDTKHQATQIVTLHIKDVNNFQPVFLNKTYKFNIKETAEPELSIGRVTATDKDTSPEYNTVTYWLEGTNSDHFRIDALTGELFLIKTIDLDVPGTAANYSFQVRASDMEPGWTTKVVSNTSTTVTVIVGSVNEYSPIFSQDQYVCNLKESYTGPFNCTVEAVDRDKGPDGKVTYTLLNNKQVFSINNLSGVLSVINALDYDTTKQPKVYYLNISASDRNKQHSTHTSVTIHLHNINDKSPQITLQSNKRHMFVVEAVRFQNGTQIGAVSIKDEDGNDGNKLNITLSDDYGGLFNIDEDGVIALMKFQTFDYETKSSYTLEVVVKDDVHPAVKKNITLDVLNVNEYAPVIIQPNLTIQENYAQKFHIQANDADKGTDGNIEFLVNDTTVTNNVTIASDGTLTVLNLDREKLGASGIFLVPVIAVDKGTPPLTGMANIEIKVTGINDNTPYYLDRDKVVNLTVDEGILYRSAFTSLAYDDDIGVGKKILYKLPPGALSWFHVRDNGVLIINRAKHGSYQLQIQAYNDQSKSKTAVQTVNINVKDVNDNKPVFNKPHYNKTKSECSKTGTTVVRVEADDADIDPEYNTVTYWIDRVDVPFTVNPRSGDIVLSRPIDFDPPANEKKFTFMVYATDLLQLDKTDSHTSSTDVTIKIFNCNDNKPHFTKDIYICNLQEGSRHTTGCSIQAVDIDDMSTLKCSIPGDNRFLRLQSGALSAPAIDYDDPNVPKHYTLNISVSDGNHTSYATVYVDLVNINDNPPEFVHKDYTISIPENAALHNIGSVKATDKDGDKLLYSMTGNCTTEIQMSPDGLLSLKNKIFDYERIKSCRFTATVNDSIHTATSTITVDITDENDNQPSFTNKSYTKTVKENVHINYSILKVQATDADGSSPNNKVTYSIVSGNIGNVFSLDNITGIITTVKILDASNQSHYTLVVQAKDGGRPALTDYVEVTINVEDVNSYPPRFLYTPYHADVTENQPAHPILQIAAKDADPTDVLNYSIVKSGQHTDMFYINQSMLYVKTLDSDKLKTKSLNITLEVTDGSHMGTAPVSVTLHDVNDNAPYFVYAPKSIDLNDTIPTGSSILQVKAKDDDFSEINSKLLYFLYDGEGYFDIDRTSGDISLLRPLDDLHREPFHLGIFVTDSGSPPKSNQINITANVIVTNKHAPHFVKPPNADDKYDINFKEGKDKQKANFAAVDFDKGEAGRVTYTIDTLADNWQTLFEFNNNTGVLTLKTPVDYEATDQHQYSFIVTAMDHAQFKKSSTATAVVHIVDVDELPSLHLPTSTVYKELNAPAGSVISRVTVNDPDKAIKYRNFTYSISGGGLDLEVNQSTHDDEGIITTKKVLSQAGKYQITITVTDGGGLTDTQTLTVDVSNITGSDLNVTIHENIEPPAQLTNLYTATHANKTIRFKMTNSSTTDNFQISPNGSFMAVKKLDREETPSFYVEIKGYENLSGKDILKAQIQMHVTVLDVNDNTPQFNQSVYNLEVKETHPVNTAITIVTASDIDENPTLTYSIKQGDSIFSIDQNSGKIMLKKSLDYDRQISYNLTVECSDESHTNRTLVLIKVLDVNNHKPVFSATSYTITLNESQALVPIGHNVTATDPDTADQGTLQYSILPSGSPLSIDSNGQLSLKYALDYDISGHSNKTMTVQAKDTAGHTSSATIHLIVLDTNDNAPVFTANPYTFTVMEGTLVKSNNYSVEASDADSKQNGKVVFTINGTNSQFFKIISHNNKGYIHIIKPLDRESDTVPHDDTSAAIYTLTVIATDQGHPPQSSTVNVHFHVEDINDCSPRFSSANYSESVQEGTAIGTKIGSVTTTDCDSNPLYRKVTYSITGPSSDVFNITSTGDVILAQKVSIKQKKFNLQVTANDTLNTAKVNLTVIVLDVNDNSPNFTQQQYTFSVSENLQPQVSVGIVMAVDDDPGENGNVSYMITSGNTNTIFSIKKSNGLITTTVKLDREQISQYSLIITAQDNAKTGRRQGTCTVVVKVTDVNDNSPVFASRLGYTATVQEDAKLDSVVHIVPPIAATDLDNGINGTAGIQYTLSPSSSPFCIHDVKTSSVQVCNMLDRESKEVYNMLVVATDDNGSGLKTNTSLDITLTDINDEAPIFIKPSSYNFSISENIPPNTAVGVVTVTDKDKDGLLKVRLSILTGGHENYYIQSQLSDDKSQLVGTIYVIGNLDREDIEDYTMTIEASDTVHTSNTTVCVEILDENDHSPVFNESHIEVPVVENATAGVIYTMVAYDEDKPGTLNSTVVFSLNSETIKDYGEKFGIYSNGSLYTKTQLDRENQTTYILIIVASDQGKPPRSTSIPVRVNVLDINDNAPEFCDTPPCKIHSYVVETAPVNSIIALPIAKDPDFGSNGTVTYSLVNSSATEYFNIDSIKGLVTIAKPIVINTLIGKNIVSKTANSTGVTLSISIEARDGGPDGGLSSLLTLLVAVEPINDNAPAFPNPCDFHIMEEMPSGTFVGNCKAVIPNATYTHMKYKLIADFDSDTFNIDSHNGTITTKTVLDREMTSHYSLSVQVTDGRTPERTAFSAVTITVKDMNDNAPVFYHNPISLQIPENKVWKEAINASALDRDSGENGAVTYTLDNDYAGTFILNATTGLFTLNGKFDREKAASFLLHIMATDHGNPKKSSSVEVNISVTDENDNAPIFQNITRTIDIQENKAGKVFSVYATDLDAGENGKVTYRLVKTDDGPFRVDTQDGSVYVDGGLDYETKKVYHLQFMASDQGLQPQNTSLNITVHVKDVYDFVPKFKNITYDVHINASSPVGTKIADIHVEQGTAQYSLSGSDSRYFSINQKTGAVTVKSTPGVHNRQYVATVTALDPLNQTAECTLIIHIVSHELIFENKTYAASLQENLATGQLLLDLNTTEEWKGYQVVYSILKVEPPVTGVFHIEPSTGKLICDESLDRESHDEYNIYVSAYLASTQKRQKRAIDDSSSVVRVTVHVTDVDDNLPYFPTSQQTLFGVPSDAGEGYLVTQLRAVDLDEGENGRVFYEAAGDTDVFGIDQNSGSIKTLVPIAGRKEKTFHLNVTAMDKDGQQNSSIDIQILVVPRADRLMMKINKPLSEFQKNQESLIRNISDILGVEVQLEKVESHRSKDGDVTQLDLNKSDMYFHGINKTSGTIVPYSKMMTLINQAQEELEKLFNTKTYEVIHVKKLYDDPSAITVPVICLIVIALLIFLGSTVGIILTLVSWSRLNHDMEMMKKHQESKLKLQQAYEMDTLRSHKSAEMAAQSRTEAVNPAYMETELVTKSKKKRVEYESKELLMSFGDEPLRFTDEVLTSNGTRSVADSALESTSLNSNDQQRTGSAGSSGTGQPVKTGPDMGLTVDEGPVMTSSPRISMDIDADRRALNNSNQGLARANSKVITFMMDSGETETETDADTMDGLYSKVQKKPALSYKSSEPGIDDAKDDTDILYSQVQKKATPFVLNHEIEQEKPREENNGLYSQAEKSDSRENMKGDTSANIYDNVEDNTNGNKDNPVALEENGANDHAEDDIKITSF